MYNVSPTPSPTTPLTTTTTITCTGKLASAPVKPNPTKMSTRTAAFDAHLTMFAETGDVEDKAFRYIIGATAQLIAAPKAANSPSIPPSRLTAFKGNSNKGYRSRNQKKQRVKPCRSSRKSKKTPGTRKPTSS
jgi:hypothetical protein